MQRPASGLLSKVLALLALAASGFSFQCLHAQPPTEAPASGIVWGPSSDDYRACDFVRAGCPQCQRKRTMPSNTRFYGGYYVGGGTPTRGSGRSSEDGTWGWDYSGILFPKRIALNWTAKGRPQGGTGAYKTDGPKLRHE